MTEPSWNWVDDLARRSPTALTMALERAISTHDEKLERAVLAALGEIGIVVVDRSALATIVARARRRNGPGEGRS